MLLPSSILIFPLRIKLRINQLLQTTMDSNGSHADIVVRTPAEIFSARAEPMKKIAVVTSENTSESVVVTPVESLEDDVTGAPPAPKDADDYMSDFDDDTPMTPSEDEADDSERTTPGFAPVDTFPDVAPAVSSTEPQPPRTLGPKQARAPAIVREKTSRRSGGGGKKTPSRRIAPLSKKVKNVGKGDAPKKKRRFKNSTIALRDIRRAQKSTELLIPRACFERLVREIVHEQSGGEELHLQAGVLAILHEAAENYMTLEFKKAATLANHSNRVTVSGADMQLITALGDRSQWN